MDHTFTITLAVLGTLLFLWRAVAAVRHVILVQEGTLGAIFHHGKLTTQLPAGRHVLWGRNLRVQPIEARRALVQVVGQEVLTADHVTVKLSIVLTTQVVDAVKALQSTDNYITHIYTTAQTALRAVVSGVSMDALLSQRAAMTGQLLELIAPKAAAAGVTVHEVEVRDFMLTGELRKVYSEVLKAKQEAQIALERARGESAALRNLANAARLVEGLPSLATLRFLQSLEKSNGQTVLLNDLSSWMPSLLRRSTPAAATETEDGFAE